jgi:hypothetical protein
MVKNHVQSYLTLHNCFWTCCFVWLECNAHQIGGNLQSVLFRLAHNCLNISYPKLGFLVPMLNCLHICALEQC